MEDNGKTPRIKLRFILRGKAPEGGASPTCSLCARSFSSAKARCGHMRWHGKSTPPPAPSSPPRPTDPVSLPPLQRPLRWARTAKRTPVVPVEMIHAEVLEEMEAEEEEEQRKDAAVVEHPSEESCTVDEREVEEQRKDAAAVEHPSEESCNVDEREVEEQRKHAAAVEHPSEESCTVDEREVEEQRKHAAAVEHPSEESCTVDAGAVASPEGDPGALEQSGQTREPSEDRPPGACACACCRRRLSRRPCDPAPSFACGPCGRTFASHHALCGHMASHPKRQHAPLSPQESHCHRSATSPATEGISRTCRRGVKRARSAEHRCNVCGRVFLTGQALGGHKRLHWQAPPVNRPTLLLLPPAPAASAAGEHMLEKGTCTAARAHDFDLNETPMVEHGEAANGHLLKLLL